MALDKATVARIAALARIKVPDSELDALAGALSKILTWVEQLDAVDVSGVEPMVAVTHARPPLREDKVTDGGIRDEILANAPETTDGFFVVPKVVE
ncbi:MAG: Asp-tRNA(Asn)/Glu-tRNA(Gln) amidotransferase subunit GatC [Alphaproteobacteria bacterium]|nr:Asp-tRNA(Asn)/Glu-tRNA(Gln) amidotransferase subunit GatC [Alphaproteobacteria bacterium]MDE2514220.1 Asp-tRNA(Asn)/Glu-tRNA(Gln) amidotransferase subunit GatC [Alphaproteobacteria bacterium]